MPKSEAKDMPKARRLSAGADEALATPTDLDKKSTASIDSELNGLVADAFSLYVKTKNFHWHMSGPHFRDYHKLLDKQAEQILEAIDPLAERVRKLGERTILGIDQIARLRTIDDSDEPFVEPARMLKILMDDNVAMAASMRRVHGICDEHGDVATASLLENYIDETEERTWYLFEANRPPQADGH